MRLSSVREATLLRANSLLSQEKNKKSYKTIQTEINKMSEIFGTDFEKRFYKNLFDEIEFKEMKSLLNNFISTTLADIYDYIEEIDEEDL